MRAILALALLAFSSASMADEVTVSFNGGELTCNLGQVTASSIADGFEQGVHASDPSGDGHGPGDADQRRAGLANVINKGDLEATCEFIRTQLGL